MSIRTDLDRDSGLSNDNLNWEKEFPAIDPFEQALEETYDGRIESNKGYRIWMGDESTDYIAVQVPELDTMSENDVNQKQLYSLPSA